MDAVEIKQIARELGADLVGIASAKTLNAFPPDPRFPPGSGTDQSALQKYCRAGVSNSGCTISQHDASPRSLHGYACHEAHGQGLKAPCRRARAKGFSKL